MKIDKSKWYSKRTVDGAVMFSGAGEVCNTYGLPLEVLLGKLSKWGVVLDWENYVEACVKDGHNLQTIRSRAKAATGDVFGPVISAEIMQQVDQLLLVYKK